jgi:carbonic anhydrase
MNPSRLIAAEPVSASVPPGEALERLVTGNARFVAGKMTHVDGLAERRDALAAGQAPFAVILGCADSRVPPELAFDLSVGDLFVCRVAGNFASNEILGSIEYAVANLGARLVVVLGHEKCGAIIAVREALQTHKPLPPHLDSIENGIRAAVAPVVAADGSLDAAIRANVHATVHKIAGSQPVVAPAVARHDVRVVGAEYHLASGAVSFI